MSNRFLANIVIFGQIKCITGLHIGGIEEKYEIGGMDNPVIRDPVTNYPYIPGSSLKGKIRSITEWARGKVGSNGEVHSCDKPDCFICRVFGSSATEERSAGPTRLIMRDAFPCEKTIEKMTGLMEEKGLSFVEVKSENSLNRITSEANPRSLERVPKGSRFNFGAVYGIYQLNGDWETDIDLLPGLFTAFRLLEDSTLGGYGSRGSGQVELFLRGEPQIRTLQEDYQTATPQEDRESPTENDELTPLKEFNVGEFQERVRQAISRIVQREKKE